ncbi:nucleotidyl transferase AbiEii/AbiGii toxin family protein [Jiangella ureilytica]|uniref:Nucleotidyl transferase AbiEii/AbiGii toxin family protein n=1 Tax=Jiangella ureilytica TaxID=2530374 RepID=A0A4R4RVW5_9ACTN|nr:nucleotidyl transferase AbiEii/AbiGii toxin family protein [Jiangella ureilytica]TDC52723.1 nucleotidyl transferase AbiEii/AbiGii toxin family protein [Jiangella ureilytica]
MTRPTRKTPAGRAYLDLQNRARREGRGTQELLTLYVVERWLARLSASQHADRFVLKGGMLLAAFGARRPTVDADALARHLANDIDTVIQVVAEIAARPGDDDGVEFLPETAQARVIRDDALYSGVRITMEARLAKAAVKFRLDVNFGDPISPAPRFVELPPLRPDTKHVRVLGYPIETVLAQKIATAVLLGATDTRVRDYADIYTLTGAHDLGHAAARTAFLATTEFRGSPAAPLSESIDDLVELRRTTYAAYRTSLRADGAHLPRDFAEVVAAVVTFADPLAEEHGQLRWSASARRWSATPTA